MKSKFFLIALISFCLVLNVSAQQAEEDELRREFDKWESGVLNDNPNFKGGLMLMAEVSKVGFEAAKIKLALKGLKDAYKITVLPVKYEKDSSGKMIRMEFTDEIAVISTPGKTKPEDFHSPTIITPVSAEANAIEISLEIGGGENPRITLSLKDGFPSVGKLHSAK